MVNIWSFLGRQLGGRCPLCGTPGDDLCAPCAADLPRGGARCVRCAAPLEGATGETRLTCADCLRRAPAFDRVVAPLLFTSPVDRLMAAFKDQHRLAVGRMLAGVLARAVDGVTPRPQVLAPVPVSAARLRERGFNQAAELARPLAAGLGIPLRGSLLQRSGPDRDQRGSGRQQRLRNVRGAFACRHAVPARVALVDDVVTTAATVDAASRVLKAAGAEWVEVWAVARTPAP